MQRMFTNRWKDMAYATLALFIGEDVVTGENHDLCQPAQATGQVSESWLQRLRVSRNRRTL